jgi:hypothetical protein
MNPDPPLHHFIHRTVVIETWKPWKYTPQDLEKMGVKYVEALSENVDGSDIEYTALIPDHDVLTRVQATPGLKLGPLHGTAQILLGLRSEHD